MYDLTDLIFEKYAEGKLTEEKMMLLLEANYSDAIKNCKVKELKTTADKRKNEQLEDEYSNEISAAEIKRIYNKYKRGEELFPAEKKVLLKVKRTKDTAIKLGLGAGAVAGVAALGVSMANDSGFEYHKKLDIAELKRLSGKK